MLSPQAQVQHRLKLVFAVFSLPRARPQPRANKRASMGRGIAYRSPRTLVMKALRQMFLVGRAFSAVPNVFGGREYLAAPGRRDFSFHPFELSAGSSDSCYSRKSLRWDEERLYRSPRSRPPTLTRTSDSNETVLTDYNSSR